jgi:hypothetical protein
MLFMKSKAVKAKILRPFFTAPLMTPLTAVEKKGAETRLYI